MLPLTVHTADASYAQGEEFDHDLTEEAEADSLNSGLLEIVPREYRVVGTSAVGGAKPGETFMAAYRIPHERALIAGGHIERVDQKKPAPKGKGTDPKE